MKAITLQQQQNEHTVACLVVECVDKYGLRFPFLYIIVLHNIQ